MSDKIRMAAPAAAYRERRRRLAASLQRPLVFFAGHAPSRNYPANLYRFRAASNYLYFGGIPLENACLVIEPGSDGDAGCVLLRPDRTADDVVWEGPAPDDADLAAAAGLTRSNVRSTEHLSALVKGRGAGHVSPVAIRTLEEAAKLGLGAPTAEEQRAIVDIRIVKDEYDLAAMRRAGQISVEAQKAALAATRPGARESDVFAAVMRVFSAHESVESFNSIITIQGETLHATGYSNRLEDGRLLLCDIGAEEPCGYAGDSTRTYPVSGRWAETQRRLYDIVLRAKNDATAACVPGARFRDVHEIAARAVCEGLIEVGLLRGRLEDLMQRRAHTLFFVHGLGHLVGLDVHDMEDFGDHAGYAPGRTRLTNFGDKFLRMDRDLLPGMCFSVEPGFYVVPGIWNHPEMAKPLADVVNRPMVEQLLAAKFGGIRIEDTVCVRTAGSPENFNVGLPTAADEIAAMVGRG